MKQGKTFEEVVEQVNQEAAMRHDFYCPTSEMVMMSAADGSQLATPGGQFEMRDRAHIHMAELCGIDRRYYQRMRTEAPFLLDKNVNWWLSNNPPRQRIVRALDSDARAIVSSRYAMLDNDALLRTVEPIIDEQGLTIESCDVGEERLTIKMVSPRLRGDVKVGDEVQAGIIVANSEVRMNAVEVNYFVKRLVCLNGMVVMDPKGRGAFRRHVGRDWNGTSRSLNNKSLHQSGSFSYGPIPENVEREQWEQAIWDEFQVSLRNSLNAGAFNDLLQRLRLTTTMTTELGLDEVAERVGQRFELRPGEQSQMLFHLSRDEDVGRAGPNLYSVVNAITRTAADSETFDRATELETLGGLVAHFSPREWERLVSPN